MSDMYFEDLPSTNTPLIANNINKLNDIKVSPTEPNTGEKVWIQKGKNLFDGILEQGNIDTSTGANSSVDASNFTRSVNYHKVKPNTSYTLNINRQNNQIVVYYYSNSAFLSYEFVMNATTYTFTTPNNCTRVRFRFSGSITIQEGQLEKGTEATTYEAYVKEKTYIKSNDNIYEEFGSQIESIKISEATFYKIGRLVVVTGWFVINAATGSFTAPYKPVSRIWAPVNGIFNTGDPSTINGYLDMNPSGQISIKMTGAITYCTGTFSYITSD